MIREIRERLAKELVNADAPWSIYTHRPDDVNDVPCVVIDRPSLTVNVQHHVASISVVVIGRRDGTLEAQSELDDVTSWVMHNLAGPEFAVVRVEPVTATVAELTYPAYEVTVSCGVTIC